MDRLYKTTANIFPLQRLVKLGPHLLHATVCVCLWGPIHCYTIICGSKWDKVYHSSGFVKGWQVLSNFQPPITKGALIAFWQYMPQTAPLLGNTTKGYMLAQVNVTVCKIKPHSTVWQMYIWNSAINLAHYIRLKCAKRMRRLAIKNLTKQYIKMIQFYKTRSYFVNSPKK